MTIAGELRALADAGCEVVVDFTVAAAARVTLPWLAMHGVHAVVGTTGFNDADLDAVPQSEFSGSNCVIASNFAISAVLMMRFAELAAPFFDTAEIIELHHDEQDRRAVGHGGHDRPADGRGLGRVDARPDPARGLSRVPAAARVQPASACTRCGCAAWWPIRK